MNTRTKKGLIVLICRNGLELTKECFKSLRAQKGSPDILIVDNASTDGTVGWSRFQGTVTGSVRRMMFREVASVSTLWNKALRWAWSHGYEDALIVNNDTELLPETYETLHNWAIPIWSENDGSESGMVTCVSRRSHLDLKYDALTSRPHPDFSCFLIRRWAWEKVGGFDEGYEGAYYEDNDFHVRLHRAGIQAVSISLPFLHHGAGTLRHSDQQEKKRIEQNAAKNRKRFFAQYGCYPGTSKYDRLFDPVPHFPATGFVVEEVR